MGEGVGDRSLEEPLGGAGELAGAGQGVVEAAQGGEEALRSLGPGQRRRLLPRLASLDQRHCPVEEVAEVGEDGAGRSRARPRREGLEPVGSVAQRLAATVGEGGEAVAEELALGRCGMGCDQVEVPEAPLTGVGVVARDVGPLDEQERPARGSARKSPVS